VLDRALELNREVWSTSIQTSEESKMIEEKILLKTAKINRPSSLIHPNPYFRKEPYSQIDLLPIFP
jgi:hypothetical protein